MDVKDELLFDPSVLKMVDWTDRKSTYKGSRSPTNPGNNLLIRPLALHDYNRGRSDLSKINPNTVIFIPLLRHVA